MSSGAEVRPDPPERVSGAHLVISAVLEDQDAAETIARAASGSSASVGSARALDGTAGEWIVLVTIAMNAIVAVLTAVRALIEARRVKSIKVGEVEIVNPTKDQVDALLADHARRGGPLLNAPGGEGRRDLDVHGRDAAATDE